MTKPTGAQLEFKEHKRKPHNGMLNQQAWKKMTLAEQITGRTVEELDELQRQMRESARRRWS